MERELHISYNAFDTIIGGPGALLKQKQQQQRQQKPASQTDRHRDSIVTKDRFSLTRGWGGRQRERERERRVDNEVKRWRSSWPGQHSGTPPSLTIQTY